MSDKERGLGEIVLHQWRGKVVENVPVSSCGGILQSEACQGLWGRIEWKPLLRPKAVD